MAIPVQSFVNVEDLVFSVDLVNQPQNHLHLITGVAIIGFTGSPADQAHCQPGRQEYERNYSALRIPGECLGTATGALA